MLASPLSPAAASVLKVLTENNGTLTITLMTNVITLLVVKSDSF